MIKNELEYRITKTTIEKLQNTLKADYATKGLEPWAKDSYLASIEAQVIELQGQLDQYEALWASKTN